MADLTPASGIRYLSDKPELPKRSGNRSLDKDDFLKILITQLTHQDPSKPMEDKEFIAQMAQFSSLEQMQNLTKAFEGFASGQKQTQMIQYNSFLGKDVSWTEITDKTDGAGKPIVKEGKDKIVGIQFINDSVEFTLASGKKISPANISGLGGEANATGSLVEASGLIGKTVTYKEGEAERSGKVVSVSAKDGGIVYALADGSKVAGSQFTAIGE